MISIRYYNHIATSLLITAPIAINTNNFTLPVFGIAALSSLMPDIDTPGSFIGKRTRGVSDSIEALAGHRGITHSLIGSTTFSLILFTLYWLSIIPMPIAIFGIIGYLSHLIADSFSKSGIKWFLPFKKKAFCTLGKTLTYTTGGILEKIIGLIILVLAGFIIAKELIIILPDTQIWSFINQILYNIQNFFK